MSLIKIKRNWTEINHNQYFNLNHNIPLKNQKLFKWSNIQY